MSDASKTKTVEELSALVLKFDMLDLPGQPKAMHMGTANLVHDLLKKARELEADLAEANARAQGLYNQAQANHIRAINAEAEIIELKKMLPRSMVGLSDEGEQ